MSTQRLRQSHHSLSNRGPWGVPISWIEPKMRAAPELCVHVTSPRETSCNSADNGRGTPATDSDSRLIVQAEYFLLDQFEYFRQ